MSTKSVQLISKKLIVIVILSFPFAISAQNQNSVIGKWKTIDDDGKSAKSIVEIYLKNDKLFGRIIKIINEEKKDSICDKCDDDDPRKGQKVLGMEIIKGLKKDDDEWDDGTILDPENGKVYRCKMWMENGKLIVRGYIGFSLIGRSQTWLRHNTK